MLTSKSKVIIYAQDAFEGESAKTAFGFIRYGLCETVAIVDRKLKGKKASFVNKSFLPIPIYESIEEAKNKHANADTLLIGIAPAGGKFPIDWLPDIKKALELRLNIVNGLHDFISDNKEIKEIADKNKLFIWDVRKKDAKYKVANAKLLNYDTPVVLTVGTDAAIGKMTVAVELANFACSQGMKAKFIATGQTGMMISGSGIPIDAITGDFMAGAIEEEVLLAVKNKSEIIFVEGQGSILHPGWSGVTLALLHGALPHKLILCHKAGRKYLKDTKVKIDSLNQFIDIYENISLPLRKAKVVGIALNTSSLNSEETCNIISEVENKTGLPADDLLKNSAEKLLKACLK